MMEPSEARDRLTDGIFVSRDPADITGCLEHALERVLAAEPVERKLRDRKIKTAAEGLAQGVISESEMALLDDAAEATRTAIMVDDFAPGEIGKKGVERSAPQQPPVALSM